MSIDRVASVLSVIVGLTLVGIALVDVVWTAVAAGSGAGPVTRRVAGRLWRFALRVHRRRPSHAFLSVSGVSIVLAVLGTWIALALSGWMLTFSASDGAVRDATTREPADLVARAYFVGYSVFTLGNGDFAPGEGSWQLATVIATATRLVLVTLAITYLVPVASAVANRRRIASYIDSLGAGPHDLLRNSWDGSGFPSLAQHLVSLTPLLHSSRHQHLTYPVLHYFHSRESESAAALTITNLAQALHLLKYGVAPAARLAPGVVQPLERAVDEFLSTLRDAYIGAAEPLVLPDLGPLRDSGIPIVDDGAYRTSADLTRERRAILAGFLVNDGWTIPSARGT